MCPTLTFMGVPFLSKHIRIKSTLLLRVLLSFVLASLNSTKHPESDLFNYKTSYIASSFYNFDELLNSIYREPGYYISEFLFSQSGLDFSVFLFTISFMSYFFMFKSFDKFFYKESVLKKGLLVVLIAFIPEFFSLSAHLLRQFTATSFCLLAIASQKKKDIILNFFLGASFHSSALLIIALYLISKINLNFKHLSFFRLAKWTVLTLTTIYLTFGLPFTNYILERVLTLDTFTTKVALSDKWKYFIIGLLLLLIFLHKHFKFNKTILKTTIFLGLTVVLLMPHIDLLAYRFFYLFIFLIPIFFIKILLNIKHGLAVIIVLCVLNVVRFSFNLNHGTWTYSTDLVFLFNPLSI